jgi:thioesterase domain-containing protein
MEEIAEELVLAIRNKQPHGPYRLGGFCLGGVVAYEVATQLTTLGQEVELLTLIEPFNHYQSARVRFVTALQRMRIRGGFHVRELRRLEPSDFPVYVRRRWRSIKSSLTDLYWRISSRFRILERKIRKPDLDRILYLAACSYRPGRLGCPAIIFRCKDYSIQSAGDPYFGWRELFTGRAEVDESPGDHLGMFQEPNVQVLADKLRTHLRMASRSRVS